MHTLLCVMVAMPQATSVIITPFGVGLWFSPSLLLHPHSLSFPCEQRRHIARSMWCSVYWKQHCPILARFCPHRGKRGQVMGFNPPLQLNSPHYRTLILFTTPTGLKRAVTPVEVERDVHDTLQIDAPLVSFHLYPLIVPKRAVLFRFVQGLRPRREKRTEGNSCKGCVAQMCEESASC